jgi:hypothetical protein
MQIYARKSNFSLKNVDGALFFDCLPVFHLVLLLVILVSIPSLVLLLLWSSSSFLVATFFCHLHCYAAAAAAIYGAVFFDLCVGIGFFSWPASMLFYVSLG